MSTLPPPAPPLVPPPRRRNARMLLMSRARSAGRDKAMLAFENLLTIGKEGTAHTTAASYADDHSIPLGA